MEDVRARVARRGYGDGYHWQTHTVEGGGYVAPNTDFDPNVSYNATIPAGGSTSFGFQGTWTAGDANPAAYALNGAACTAG
jgi:hypothetical protein